MPWHQAECCWVQVMREEMLQSLAESQGQGNKFCKFLENKNSSKISELKQDIQENFKQIEQLYLNSKISSRARAPMASGLMVEASPVMTCPGAGIPAAFSSPVLCYAPSRKHLWDPVLPVLYQKFVKQPHFLETFSLWIALFQFVSLENS